VMAVGTFIIIRRRIKVLDSRERCPV
jgi:hypothetical protein